MLFDEDYYFTIEISPFVSMHGPHEEEDQRDSKQKNNCHVSLSGR